MKISLNKFGTTLTSRQMGKEAYAAYRPTLSSVSDTETVEIDFDGVITFSPSWGDEFLLPLSTTYKERLFLSNTKNPSVSATVKFLEDIHHISFRVLS